MNLLLHIYWDWIMSEETSLLLRSKGSAFPSPYASHILLNHRTAKPNLFPANCLECRTYPVELISHHSQL